MHAASRSELCTHRTAQTHAAQATRSCAVMLLPTACMGASCGLVCTDRSRTSATRAHRSGTQRSRVAERFRRTFLQRAFHRDHVLLVLDCCQR